MEQYVIHIDNGHGLETPGKRSPDGRLVEAQWNRDIAGRLQSVLQESGYDARLVVPEGEDIPLLIRCSRVNSAIKKEPEKSHIFISIHINAAPPCACNKEGWCDSASGWTVYVAKNASKSSCRLAQNLYSVAEEFGLKGNRILPSEKYLTANYTVLQKVNCPSVLTESLFMTNHQEVDFLLSEEGKDRIVNLHLIGLCRYLGNPASNVFTI